MEDSKPFDKMAVMLRKFRRGSKDTYPYPTPRNGSVATLPSTTEPAPLVEGKLTFFDLPAELRNEVYNVVASDTHLTLPSSEQRSKKLFIRPTGLLLASRQCRKEYLPLLFSTATVILNIKDFDFQNLLRVTGSLYSTELKSLRTNNNLLIRLRTCNCTRENMQSLRRWLISRANGLDRLPWQYEVLLGDATGRMGCFRQSRELAYYGERLARLQCQLEDSLQWELGVIVEAFERKGRELDAVLQGVTKPRLLAGREARGLSGGGLI
ncbi:hypothetical protein BAUCODRAFT_269352 [Baudoinia panamericana UAMH 10762]|uniref:F-box domain-containing protein n=1 Tax=Baudoinia panamericana (strain UAMH 10762) TaxID=717646 RepID=M2N1Z6_BAUPA|nr:uncharacterized protein BAUCODRAFT_269352 [Baudoinia panamericana UAMH 10762]EMC92989.1 hypothetical protein BAUCODRAFT_269352 [Baudoinia panamericana UAMH 10762]